jgi:hypothetical protein
LEVSRGELDPFGEQHQRARQQEGQHGDQREEVYVIHGFLLQHQKNESDQPLKRGNMLNG